MRQIARKRDCWGRACCLYFTIAPLSSHTLLLFGLNLRFDHVWDQRHVQKRIRISFTHSLKRMPPTLYTTVKVPIIRPMMSVKLSTMSCTAQMHRQTDYTKRPLN